MKKFLLKFSIFFAYAFLLQVVFPYVVDPFNVFHAEKMRFTGTSANDHYIKTKYILDNPDKYNSFMLGSSRVGAIHTDKIRDVKIYNMNYSGGLISENLATLKTFLKNKIFPRRIYIGIDGSSSTAAPEGHINQPIFCPYEYLTDKEYFYGLYLQPFDALCSLWYFFTKPNTLDIETFYKYGWWCEYGRTATINWENDEIKPSVGKTANDNVLPNALNVVNEIVEICKEHGTKLIIFTNPVHHITYQASVEENYFEFLEGLAKITDFYNFSSLNDVTLNNDNYLETSHYKAEVGDMIIEVICNGKRYDGLYEQGFGVKVTKENVDDFINMLKAQMKNYKK